MNSLFLFPHSIRKIGYIFILAYLPIMVVKKLLHNGYNNYDPVTKLTDANGIFNSEHMLGALASILIVSGLLIIAFAKEKIEDEQIIKLRLESLQWAIYLNYAIFILGIAFTSNFHYRDVLLVNIWTPLIFFIVRFRWVMLKLNRSTKADPI
jgi:hypothetical protein